MVKPPPLLIEEVLCQVIFRPNVKLMDTFEMKAEVVGPAPEPGFLRAGATAADVVLANAQLAVSISLVAHKFVEQPEPVARFVVFAVRVRAGEIRPSFGFQLMHIVDVPTKCDRRGQAIFVPFAVRMWARVGFRTVHLLQVAVEIVLSGQAS